MPSVAIIHFQPLELYPPVQNLIRYLENDSRAVDVCVYTTTAAFQNTKMFEAAGTKIKIVRLAKSGQQMSAVARYWNYCRFYMGCLFDLMKRKPASILYYETLSSFPAWLYKKYYNKAARILIHYHEYTSLGEYSGGMMLNRHFHKLEKDLYPIANWVSHTNQFRMNQFVKDIYPVKINQPNILPNYPPAAWKKHLDRKSEGVIKIVYAGAVSIDTMFVKEFTNWVMAQNGKVVWDIYSLNITAEAAAYFKSVSSAWINFKAGVNYDQLPSILAGYQIGVVLYKGHIPNYVFNAPNKIFEYLAAGLDVWFPDVMVGSLEYITKSTFPKVIAVDFSKLDSFSLEIALDRNGFEPAASRFFCEDVLPPIVNSLF